MAGLTDISLANYMEIKVGDALIGHLESFSGLSEETSVVEVKQYNNKMARKLPASGSVAAVELTQSFVPSDAGYVALMAARRSEALTSFTVTYYKDATKAAKETRTFKGYVNSYSESGELDSHRQCTWSIAVDGAITYGAATREAK
ncbi:hypothetical protein [Vibrio parahaemolyticus]|uniref:hypothetical protein n=1 Tax=Vibrio parahaemolyticus TaxID=670 RepID=UPI0005F26EE6|nr:hypothetical protein [Vibrio parahaemolyticus]KJR15238.1 hypothetical protein UF28_16360 [Vibrio parahaemolyticus]